MEGKGKKKKALLAASVAGLLAATGVVSLPANLFAADEVHCYGVNACQGKSACKGQGHACAGKNACKGQGFIKVESKDACLKMDGGRLTPEVAKP